MKKITIGLIGNPNSGKTTVFNALTGSSQRIGNWPGVTVERKSGLCKYLNNEIKVIDLPGTYSHSIDADATSLDEKIACEFITENQADIIVNIVDANNLERNLYLTTQLMELQAPIIVALNMTDIAKQRGLAIDDQALAKTLGCPVVSLQASKKIGIKELQAAIINCSGSNQGIKILYTPELEQAITKLIPQLSSYKSQRWLALRLLEDDSLAQSLVTKAILDKVKSIQEHLTKATNEDADILLANSRYEYIAKTVKVVCQKQIQNKSTLTAWLDKLVLNRILGIPIFLFIMYLMFLFSVTIGRAFQDFFDIVSDTIFVQGLSHVLTQVGLPGWFIAIFGVGLGKGINTTVTFIPVIAAMFLFLSFLERSGYISRAAFVVDRFMRGIGLPGKSFVPMIVGFGCNVPAIMGSRTLENHSDRVVTVLMTPFMSCGARLSIYAVFTTAFFARDGALIVFALYFIGIFVAILTGLILRKTILQGESSPFILELPPYHLPSITGICLHAWQRAKAFLYKAGKFIIPICILISALNAVTFSGKFIEENSSSQSVLDDIGRNITPVFEPMGIQKDNWPAVVGLLTGTLAKEVVVGALNTLYSSQLGVQEHTDNFDFMAGIREAIISVPQNLGSISDSLLNPLLASTQISVDRGVLSQMAKQFPSKTSAFAYLLFILLYVPCVSTIAVMAKEINRAWATFSVIWSTGMAYGLAVIFYQITTLATHPASSLIWICTILLLLIGTVLGLRSYSRNRRITT